MIFVRWLILERFLPSFNPENLFLGLVFSLFIAFFFSTVLYPGGLIIALPIFVFWGIIGYVVFTEWLSEMRKEWEEDTHSDK